MSAPIDLSLVPVFVEVVRARSFSVAARQLEMPRSTVSRQVARLEEQLGTELLHRTTRKVGLTEAGAAYYDRVARALQAIEEARVELLESHQRPSGTLRLSLPFDLGWMIAPALVQLVERYPDLRLEIEPSNRHVDLIAEGYDAALRASPGLEDSSLVARKLLAVPFGLLASPALS